MALTICGSCDSFYNEKSDKCEKCHKTVPKQIEDFRKKSLFVTSKAIEDIYWKGYNEGVRTVNKNIVLF